MIASSPAPRLILASSSAYRRELLARLRLPFEAIAPEIDEAPLAAETPTATALRLARAKAAAVAARAPGALVIGSDQVATLDGEQIGKPGSHAAALAQLRKMRGREVVFHTALCLWDGRVADPDAAAQVEDVRVTVAFRDLPDAELDAYLRIEQPYDCAGSAKNEGLGIALLERIDNSDPTALTGLPLIALTSMLRRAGVSFFTKNLTVVPAKAGTTELTMTGTLYLIPNTLGPTAAEPDALAHILPDQVQAVASRLDYFVAENAKTARAFLKLVGLQHPLAKPLQEIEIAELNVNTPAQALDALLQPLLAGRDAGLVSEAGVPAVADPGADLVRLAHQHGITVRPLVGPSSLLLAVMASGLNGQSFAFNGYLPTDAEQRARRIKDLEQRSRKEKQTQLFIETPYRNAAMLDALVSNCQPATLVCVATDLSLPSETVRTLTAAKWKAALADGKGPDFHKKPTVFLLLGQ